MMLTQGTVRQNLVGNGDDGRFETAPCVILSGK